MFTARGVWGFNPLYVTGISIFNLPIEEVLFFICIPFACVFTYHSLSLFWKIKWSPAAENTVVSILAAGLLLAGLFNYDKLYTVVTFIGTALALVALRYYFKVTWLPRFLMVYLVLLIPFFIVNGVLTGTAIEGEVVWYDDAENLGIRLGTIPVEDIIYGFLLIMMNVFFFERFKK